METTRTSSPYFSPKSAWAPMARASSGVMIRVSTLEFCRMITVHLRLDLGEVLARQRVVMREIEPQPVRRVERAALRHMIAQPLAQRLMQQMGRGMVGPDRAAPRMIDHQPAPAPAEISPSVTVAIWMKTPATFLVSVISAVSALGT